MRLAKATEAFILDPLIDSVEAVQVAQKYESLKLIEEKDSLFASNVTLPSGNLGSACCPDQALVDPHSYKKNLQNK